MESIPTTVTPHQSEETLNEIRDQITENDVNNLAIDTVEPAYMSITSDTSHNINDTEQYLDLPLCRICWLDGVLTDLISLPCKCQGTMGNVHVACLREWEKIRKSRRCEICKEVYLAKRDFFSLIGSFFKCEYAGVFFCKIMNIGAAAVLAYANIVLGEMNIVNLISTEKVSSHRNGLSYPLLILSAAIFPYFVINYFAVDYAMSEVVDCYRLIRDWWYNES